MLVLACVFTACGTPAEKNEKEIAADLQQTMATSNEIVAEFSISSMEVEKRRTDKDSGLDTVYVWADVETDLEQGICTYYYQGEESLYNGYCVKKYDVALEYVFDKTTGVWNEPREHSDWYTSWEYLAGTWQTSADVGLWTLYGHPKRTAHVDLTLVIDDIKETDLHAVVWHHI